MRQLNIDDVDGKKIKFRPDESKSKFRLLCEEPYWSSPKDGGHNKDVVDFSWSPCRDVRMLLSASVDRTVRLWFIGTDKPCLVFKHKDIVSSVDFYPLADSSSKFLFVTGCMDKEIRLWEPYRSMEEMVGKQEPKPKKEMVGKKEQGIHEDMHKQKQLVFDEPKDSVSAPEYVTSVSFRPDGKMVAAGLTRSQLMFFSHETHEEKGLRFFTQMDLKNRSGHFRHGRNVTGIKFIPKIGCEAISSVSNSGDSISGEGEMLVSINDSRIRLCDMEDFSVIAKVKGAQNESMQIKASVSDDGKYIISGSETGGVYIWSRDCGLRQKDKVVRNQSYSTFNATAIPGAPTVVAIFAPEAAVKKATQINTGAYILDYTNLCARIIVTASEGEIHVYSRGLGPDDDSSL